MPVETLLPSRQIERSGGSLRLFGWDAVTSAGRLRISLPLWRTAWDWRE